MKTLTIITVLVLTLGFASTSYSADNTIHKVVTSRDESGRVLEERTVDANGNLIQDELGNAPIKRYEYNKFGERITTKFFGLNGEPCTVSGIHIALFEYHNEGQVIESKRYGIHGEPVEDTAFGCHIFRILTDGTEQCIGLDGKLKKMKQSE